MIEAKRICGNASVRTSTTTHPTGHPDLKPVKLMKDSDLNTLFKDLRKTESQAAPPFDRIARRPQHSRRRSIRLAPIIGLVAGVCSVALVLALWTRHPSTAIDEIIAFTFTGDSVTQPLSELGFALYESDSQAIVRLIDTEWVSPTAFLLDLESSTNESS